MLQRWSIPFALALATGCLTPRSMTLGTMAAPLGRGSTEVGVFGGVGYVSQTDPQVSTTNPVTGDTSSSQHTGRGFGLPSAEANVQHGFNDHVALNVHASPAGIQPGLKWTINTSRVAHVALLPAVAFGYASYGGSTLAAGSDGVQTEVAPTSTTSFTFLAGLKILVSHRSGFYAGVGYDLVFNRSLTSSTIGSANTMDRIEDITVNVAHQIMAAIGFDIAFGAVHLRPEIAFAAVPLINSTWTARRPGLADASTSAGGGYAFSIMPGFSIAVASPTQAKAEEEEERPDKVRDGEDEGDEDERPAARKSRRSVDDEDGETEERPHPKMKRKQREDDD